MTVRYQRGRVRRVLASLAIGSVAATGIMVVTAPAASAFGTKGSYCHGSRIKYAHARRVVLKGVTAHAFQAVCYRRSRYGSHYIKWTGQPSFTYVATSTIGAIQRIDRLWGPRVTAVKQRRMSPWENPNTKSIAYIVWAEAQRQLGHPPMYRPIRVDQSEGVRATTISVAGIKFTSDAIIKTQVKYGKGLRICVVAPTPGCGRWARFS